jgi:hypothetical protein
MKITDIYPVTVENFANWLGKLQCGPFPAERGAWHAGKARWNMHGSVNRLEIPGQWIVNGQIQFMIGEVTGPRFDIDLFSFEFSTLGDKRTEITAKCEYAPESVVQYFTDTLMPEIARIWPPERQPTPPEPSAAPSGRPPKKDYDWAYAEEIAGRSFGDIYAEWKETPEAQDLAEPRKSLQNAIKARKKKGRKGK